MKYYALAVFFVHTTNEHTLVKTANQISFTCGIPFVLEWKFFKFCLEINSSYPGVVSY